MLLYIQGVPINELPGQQEVVDLIVIFEQLNVFIGEIDRFPFGACDIIAELGSLKQYSARELSAMSGLAPRIKESGSSVHSSFMSRRSSGRLRQILYLDSFVGVNKIPALHEFHQRLLEKGKKKMTVRCACMRKMLLILRSIVINQMVLRRFLTRKKGNNRDEPMR